MVDVRFSYDNLDSSHLRRLAANRGTAELTAAEIAVGLDADLRIVDRDAVVYEEPSFPVVELAIALHHWIADEDHDEFLFNSMSIEEIGAVYVRRRQTGWVFGSVFATEICTSPIAWADVETCVRNLCALVANDLTA